MQRTGGCVPMYVRTKINSFCTNGWRMPFEIEIAFDGWNYYEEGGTYED